MPTGQTRPKRPKETRQNKQRTPGQKAVHSVFSVIGKSLLTVLIVMMITGSIVSVVLMTVILRKINTQEIVNLDHKDWRFTSVIMAMNYETGQEEELEQLYSDENSEWVDYANIPQTMKDAVVSIEDKRFWEHDGVDWKRTAAAGINLFIPILSSQQGGSTLDQQLIKNVTGDKAVRVDRKVEEIFKAVKLEQVYSKETILEAYLNIIPLGNQTRGVQMAAKVYFGKTVDQLELWEIASIAGITKNPTKYDPINKPEENKIRRDHVLWEMHDQGKITTAEYENAIAQPVVAGKVSEAGQDGTYVKPPNSWSVDALQDEVMNNLMDTYNYTRTEAANKLYSGGYTIHSTIDSRIQGKLEQLFAGNVFENPIFKSVKINAKELPFNATAVVMTPNGAVRGMMGDTQPKLANRIFNIATKGLRQPGSTIKPLAIYAPAIQNDLVTWSTMYQDQPINITIPGQEPWTPANYYEGYSGRMTVDMAIRRSVNTVAVQVEQKVTPQVSFAFLRDKVGITTLVESREIDGTIRSDVNLAPMSLGALTHGVSMYEWVGAYQIFMNGGQFTKPHLYTKVVDTSGKVILSQGEEPTQAIDPDTAMVMNKLLQNVVHADRGTGSYAANAQKGTRVAGKTGTSNDNRDLWFVGATPDYVAGVWIGYSKFPRPVPSSGVYAPVLTWTEIMKEIQPIAGDSGVTFPETDTVVELEYCTVTGLKALPTCPKAKGYYKKSNQPRLCSDDDMLLAEQPTGAQQYELDKNGNLVEISSSALSSSSETGGITPPTDPFGEVSDSASSSYSTSSYNPYPERD